MPICLGIDVGRAKVKAAVVRVAYRKTTLEAFAVVDIPETPFGSEIAGAIHSAAGLALAQVGAPDAVATAIDGARATVRTVSLPAGAMKQIGEVLPFELEAQVPFELSEAVFDYRTLSSDGSQPDTATLPLLVGVARTADVQARIDLVRTAIQVEPERVGLGALPLTNVVTLSPPSAGEGGPVVIVDIDQKTSDVLILARGEAVFARTLSYGTFGLPESATQLAREIRLTIGAFRAAGGGSPERVYLCGDGAFESGAVPFLAAELGLPCEALPVPVLDAGLTLPPNWTQEFPRFAKAVGLALAIGPRALDLDLRRGPLAFERGFAWIREKVPLLAGLFAVVLVSFFFSGWAKLHGTSLDKDRLEKALALVSKDVLGEETTSAERANELLTQQTTGLDDDPLPHADAFGVMVKLSEAIPPTMTSDIEDLDVQKGHVVVHGIVGSIPEAQTISENLKKDRCFSDVKIARTVQMIGADRQKYVLEFDLKCPEDVHGPKKKEPSAPAPSPSGGGK